jgi:predicted RecA/RadA family phage recombinase
MQALFVSGDPLMIPYIPGSDVSAGDVIIEGAKAYIAHHDIAAGETGSVGASGGVYEIVADDNSVIDFGDKVYWDGGAEVATGNEDSTTPLGWAATSKAFSESTIRIEHGAF